jgi:hypothetical protein
MWNDETWLQLIDTSLLASESHTLEMMRCINIALLCVQDSAAGRTTMSEVVAMLSNDSVTLPAVTPIFKDKNRMHKVLMCAPGHDRTHK